MPWHRAGLASKHATAGLAIGVAAAALFLTPSAQANGDPASDYLLVAKVFLPFNAKPSGDAVKRLNSLLDAAAKQEFPIRAAVILRPTDLGTAFSLFRQPQRYAEFLGKELAFLYRERLLVVMPNGFGYAKNGRPAPKVAATLKALRPPGVDATKEVEAAVLAVQRIAASDGRTIEVSESSPARDRITIAAVALGAVACIGALLLYRRRREPHQT